MYRKKYKLVVADNCEIKIPTSNPNSMVSIEDVENTKIAEPYFSSKVKSEAASEHYHSMRRLFPLMPTSIITTVLDTCLFIVRDIYELKNEEKNNIISKKSNEIIRFLKAIKAATKTSNISDRFLAFVSSVLAEDSNLKNSWKEVLQNLIYDDALNLPYFTYLTSGQHLKNLINNIADETIDNWAREIIEALAQSKNEEDLFVKSQAYINSCETEIIEIMSLIKEQQDVDIVKQKWKIEKLRNLQQQLQVNIYNYYKVRYFHYGEYREALHSSGRAVASRSEDEAINFLQIVLMSYIFLEENPFLHLFHSNTFNYAAEKNLLRSDILKMKEIYRKKSSGIYQQLHSESVTNLLQRHENWKPEMVIQELFLQGRISDSIQVLQNITKNDEYYLAIFHHNLILTQFLNAVVHGYDSAEKLYSKNKKTKKYSTDVMIVSRKYMVDATNSTNFCRSIEELIEYYSKVNESSPFFVKLLNQLFDGITALVIKHFELAKGAKDLTNALLFLNLLADKVIPFRYAQGIRYIRANPSEHILYILNEFSPNSKKIDAIVHRVQQEIMQIESNIKKPSNKKNSPEICELIVDANRAYAELIEQSLAEEKKKHEQFIKKQEIKFQQRMEKIAQQRQQQLSVERSALTTSPLYYLQRIAEEEVIRGDFGKAKTLWNTLLTMAERDEDVLYVSCAYKGLASCAVEEGLYSLSLQGQIDVKNKIHAEKFTDDFFTYLSSFVIENAISHYEKALKYIEGAKLYLEDNVQAQQVADEVHKQAIKQNLDAILLEMNAIHEAHKDLQDLLIAQQKTREECYQKGLEETNRLRKNIIHRSNKDPAAWDKYKEQVDCVKDGTKWQKKMDSQDKEIQRTYNLAIQVETTKAQTIEGSQTLAIAPSSEVIEQLLALTASDHASEVFTYEAQCIQENQLPLLEVKGQSATHESQKAIEINLTSTSPTPLSANAKPTIPQLVEKALSLCEQMHAHPSQDVWEAFEDLLKEARAFPKQSLISGFLMHGLALNPKNQFIACMKMVLIEESNYLLEPFKSDPSIAKALAWNAENLPRIREAGLLSEGLDENYYLMGQLNQAMQNIKLALVYYNNCIVAGSVGIANAKYQVANFIKDSPSMTLTFKYHQDLIAYAFLYAAARAGDTTAKFELSMRFWVSGDYSEAISLLFDLAINHSLKEAGHVLSWCFALGLGVTQDIELAQLWWQWATNANQLSPQNPQAWFVIPETVQPLFHVPAEIKSEEPVVVVSSVTKGHEFGFFPSKPIDKNHETGIGLQFN